MPHACHQPPPSCMRSLCIAAFLQAHKLVTQCTAEASYYDEISIQEPRTNHRKLDSQTVSHRARGRAADGLRSQLWSLRPPGRLHVHRVRIWVLRSRPMVKRGPCMRPQASEGSVPSPWGKAPWMWPSILTVGRRSLASGRRNNLGLGSRARHRAPNRPGG